MESGQSAPGQFAKAIKNADPHKLREPLRPAAISHGHEGDDAPLPWPDHIIRESGEVPPELTGNVGRYGGGDGENPRGAETATDPS